MPRSTQDALAEAEVIFQEGEHCYRVGEYRWACVAYFYSAMNMIQAALPTIPTLTVAQQHPESHAGTAFGAEGTNVIVRKYIPSVKQPYASLFNQSVAIRYHGQKISLAVADHHRNNDLPPIARWTCLQAHGVADCDCWMRAV